MSSMSFRIGTMFKSHEVCVILNVSSHINPECLGTELYNCKVSLFSFLGLSAY